jgi:hypothetical protein
MKGGVASIPGSARASRAGCGAPPQRTSLFNKFVSSEKSPRWRGRHNQHARRARSPNQT